MSTVQKQTRTEYDYSAIGNVTTYVDYGNEETPDDDLTATITYHSVPDLHLMASPKSITVKNGGVTLRKREASIDAATGNVTQIRQFLSEEERAVYDLEYYPNGNLKKITRPKNKKDQRLSVEYTYDTEVNIYPVKVTNSYGYSSEATYDVKYGQVLTSKDLNGQEITYTLDKKGRVNTITGPYEQQGGKQTIQFDYHHDAAIPWALTKHYDPAFPNNCLETEIFVDGLGRVLQTKKDGAIYEGEGKADREVMIVSGRVEFDGLGRTVSAWYPKVEKKAQTPGGFNGEENETIAPTKTAYDVLNRTLTVTLPDGAVTETAYGFGPDRDGVNQFSTKTTDANGKQTEQFTDVRGRVTAVKNYTAEKDVWTSFKYDILEVRSTNNEVRMAATSELRHHRIS